MCLLRFLMRSSHNRYKKLSYSHPGKCIGSTIFSAVEKQTELPVVIKRIAKERYNPEEVKILRDLTGTRLPTFVEIFNERRYVNIVMENIEGHRLFRYIDDRAPLPEDSVIDIVKEIARATLECHSEGIVHLNIEPDSLIFNLTLNRIFLTEFGMAQKWLWRMDQVADINYCSGTPGFCAPETRKGLFHPNSDSWSIGCVAFMCLTRLIPLLDCSVDDITDELIDRKIYCYLLHCSQACIDFFKKIFVIDPLKRMEVSDILEDRWILGDDLPQP